MWGKLRPNIVIAMVLMATIGIVVAWMGWRMDNEGIMSASGVGALVGIANLGAKILEGE